MDSNVIDEYNKMKNEGNSLDKSSERYKKEVSEMLKSMEDISNTKPKKYNIWERLKRALMMT